MKKYIRPVYCGISGKPRSDGSFDWTVDFHENSDRDVISFIEPYYTKSSIHNNVYWFGYNFKGNLSREYRDACIRYIKEVQEEPEITEDNEFDDVEYSAESLSEYDLNEMVVRSISNIHLDEYSIDTIIYPKSSSNQLVKLIAKCIKRYLSNSDRMDYVEVLKSDPSKIELDTRRILRDIQEGDLVVPAHVDEDYLNDMLEDIHHSSEFSLRNDIHPTSLRRYVKNFLEIRDADAILNDSRNVLIVDDIFTTGTTINEIIRIIHTYNPDCTIYVFTLIGKRRIR